MIVSIYETVVPKEVHALHHCAFFMFISEISSSNHLQKGEKLAKGVNKLVGKVSIN